MGSNFKIILTPFGEESLYDLREFIFNQSKDSESADNIICRIITYTGNLSFNPFMGRALSEYKLQNEDVRRITTLDKRYNIYYNVNEQFQEVYILKIADGRQSMRRQLLGL